MAQTNYTPISLYYSTTASAVPTAANLVPGELAINTNDGKLYYEDSSGVVQVLATKSTGSIGGSNTQVQFNNSGSLGGSSSFTWDGTTVTATKFAGALNGTVGATTASTGAFTTINASTSITNAGLTSGRVTYAGASGLLSDSANLTWDNTNARLGIGTASPGYKLHVVGSGTNAQARIESTSTANAQLSFVNTSVSGTGFVVGLINDTSGNGLIYHPDAKDIQIYTNSAERMRITSAGLVGIGTSSPTLNLSVGIASGTGGINHIYTGAGGPYSVANFTSNLDTGEVQIGGVRANYFPTFYSSGSERMRIDTSGNVLIGTTSSVAPLTVDKSVSNNNIAFIRNSNTTAGTSFGLKVAAGTNSSDYAFGIDNAASSVALMRVYGDGSLNVSGAATVNAIGLNNIAPSYPFDLQSASNQNIQIFRVYNSQYSVDNLTLKAVAAFGASTTNAAMYVGNNSGSARSINAGGTVNVGGLDYAEYMTKCNNFTLNKGDICGINSEGKLTNVFADAISFVVKSTNPSYVGGDTWFTEKQPTDETMVSAWEERMETARQNVDRISFSGQVPVNVTSATVGQYIIPVNNNGAIKGMAVNEDDLTMSQYIKSVGKVIKVVDGKPTIIVKVA